MVILTRPVSKVRQNNSWHVEILQGWNDNVSSDLRLIALIKQVSSVSLRPSLSISCNLF